MSVYSQIEKGLHSILKDSNMINEYISMKHKLVLKKSDRPVFILLGLLILCHKLESWD